MVEVTDSAEAADAADEDGEVLEFWDQQLPASGALFPRLVSTLRLSQVPSVTYHRAMTEHYLQRTVLDMAADNFTVSCVSSDNGLGEPVSSTTTVNVQCELWASLFQI